MIEYIGKEVSKPWFGEQEPLGTWAQCGVEDNEVVLKKCTDPRCPLGTLVSYQVVEGKLIATVSCEVGFYLTTQYDQNVRYPLNAILYVEDGKLTTIQKTEDSAGIGIVVSPPKLPSSTLEFYRVT